jgi:enterobactin synthetase component D
MHDFGTLVGVSISKDAPSEVDLARLLAEERKPLERYRHTRRGTWVGGRIALIEASARLGVERKPIINDDRGAPILPDGLIGTLTHKNELAIALLAKDTDGFRIGIDLERVEERQEGIAKMILTAKELAEYESLSKAEREMYLITRFSIKEAIYKALDPFVRRYVGFHEVELQVNAQGRFVAQLNLKHNEGPFEVQLRCETLCIEAVSIEPMVLSAARVRPRSISPASVSKLAAGQ